MADFYEARAFWLSAVFKLSKYHISFCLLNHIIGYSTLGWGRARLSVPLQKNGKGTDHMSILGRIIGSIFGRAEAAPATALGGAKEAISGAATAVSAAASAAAEPVKALSAVDLVALMESKAAAAGQPLNWRTSIVDLMKLLNLDSSLGARKELASELGYTGDMNDSATMNIWLHKQVMKKVAENGGTVPADLLS
jgi:hypothetical protein